MEYVRNVGPQGVPIEPLDLENPIEPLDLENVMDARKEKKKRI